MFNFWVFIAGLLSGMALFYGLLYLWFLYDERKQAERDFLENDD